LATTRVLPTASGAMPHCGLFRSGVAGAAIAICRCPCCTRPAAASSWARVGACFAQLRLVETPDGGLLQAWDGTELALCHAACQSAALSAAALAQRALLLRQLHYADAALVVGGQHFDGWLSRTLWLYNATEDSWARVGNAPLYNRGHVCGLHAGQLFMALGQQGKGEWRGRAGLSLLWAAGLINLDCQAPAPASSHTCRKWSLLRNRAFERPPVLGSTAA